MLELTLEKGNWGLSEKLIHKVFTSSVLSSNLLVP